MKNKILILLLLPLLALRCNKDNDPEPVEPEQQLPEATQTGANTFGCLINGEAYLPNGNFNKPGVNMSYGAGGLLIESNNTKKDIIIRIDIEEIEYVSQTFDLISSDNPWTAATYMNNDNSYIIDDSLHIGELIITRFDTEENIVSGTFWFNAVNENNPNDVIHITNGRFDLR